jgi:hypothetical protein
MPPKNALSKSARRRHRLRLARLRAGGPVAPVIAIPPEEMWNWDVHRAWAVIGWVVFVTTVPVQAYNAVLGFPHALLRGFQTEEEAVEWLESALRRLSEAILGDEEAGRHLGQEDDEGDDSGGGGAPGGPKKKDDRSGNDGPPGGPSMIPVRYTSHLRAIACSQILQSRFSVVGVVIDTVTWYLCSCASL